MKDCQIITKERFISVMYSLESPTFPLIKELHGEQFLNKKKDEFIKGLNYAWEEMVPDSSNQRRLAVFILAIILKKLNQLRELMAKLPTDEDRIELSQKVVDSGRKSMSEAFAFIEDIESLKKL